MTNPQPSGNHSRAFRKARRELERVIQAGDPEQSPRAALELGALFKAYGQPEAAERAYQRALGFGHREVAARAQVELESLRSSGAGSADGRPRWWSTVNGNVFVGLFGVVSVFIGVFDVSSPIKLGYLLVALVVCFLIALVVRPNQASARWSSRAGWWRAAIVVVALLLALGVRPLIQVVSPQSVSTGATLPQACSAGLPIGQGAPSASVSKAFRDAYLLAGGEARLGVACNEVTRLDEGWHQNLYGPAGGGVILLRENSGQAYVLVGEVYEGWLSLAPGHPERITGLVGYPVNAGIDLPHGLQLDLVARDGTRSAAVKREGGAWFWVQGRFWETYANDLGGPEGRLGYPTGNASTRRGGDCQAFEQGWLLSTEHGVEALMVKEPAACRS
jgi:hypothetical protein